MKFKRNGTWVTWTNALSELGPDLIDESKTNLGITGYKDNLHDQLDITIQSGAPTIGTGTYSSDDYFIWILHSDNYPQSTFYILDNADGREESRYTITITSITNESISGHFTGNYLKKVSTDDEFTEITQGQFVAKRVR